MQLVKQITHGVRTQVGPQYINAKDFGAAGDGVTDDSVALQAAIDYVGTNRTKKLLIPPGTYMVGTPLNLKSDIEINGAGSVYGYTKLKSVGDNVILQNSSLIIRTVIRSLMLDHQGGHNGTKYALDLVDAYMMLFDDVRITVASGSARIFKGMRIRKSDSLRFLNLHITECRGQNYALGYGCTQIGFFGCSFECDTGLPASWSEIDMYALHGDSAPTNYQGGGEGIQFFGCQHERVNVYVNHAGVIMDNGGGGTVNMQFDKQCRRVNLRNVSMPSTYLSITTPHVTLENVDANNCPSFDGKLDWDSANVIDSLFRVYGGNKEYLLLTDVISRSATVTAAGCTFTADVAGLLESSDTKDLVQMSAVTSSIASRDEFSWATLLEVPTNNNYITVAPVGTTAGIKVRAYPNLLTNGDFTAGTAITGWTATNTTPVFAGGYVQFNATAANMSLRQTGLTVKTGHKYLLMARVKGTNVQLSFGNVTDGTVGNREAMANSSAVRTATYADGSYLLSCVVEATGARTDVSIGYLGTPADQPQIKWIALVDLSEPRSNRASSVQPFAASFTPVYQQGKSEQIIRVGQMTANMTALNAGNTSALAVDDIVTFWFQQDATAGRTIAWNAIYKFNAAFTAAVLTTDANKYCTVSFRWDGTNFRQISPANVWIA